MKKYFQMSLVIILTSLLIACNNQENISEPAKNIGDFVDDIEDNNVINDDSDNNIKKIVLEANSENFLEILSTNPDGKEYLEKYPKTRVTKIQLIKPEEFLKLKNETRFKELYDDLPQKELYYVEFEGNGNLALMTVIDLDKKNVEKIFGKMIMGLG
ncbi:MAG: hypothetical protein KC589_05330 [Nanoarchaeota archaeon]|nr:hypothetical protein [Nanoarchaeota archaeon]